MLRNSLLRKKIEWQISIEQLWNNSNYELFYEHQQFTKILSLINFFSLIHYEKYKKKYKMGVWA